MLEIIDLRSDTVTRPTTGMRAAMAAAEVGDDVFGDDPTVRRLEDRVADLLGKEAAIYVPSGTMSNQIALNVHLLPGDEVLCDSNCHIYNYEAGGPAILSGVTCRTIDGEFGILDLCDLEDKIRNPDDVHLVRTRMVALENTHNRGGGRIYPIEKIEAISQWARKNGLIMHLDGARLWNAMVATGISAREWGKHFDTVSVCFSKGLGAPVGSALAGPKAVITKARRTRKLFGGGMRQAGIIAAACIYAIDHNIERMADDHRNAQVIAQAIADTPGLTLEPTEVDTNLVWFRIDPAVATAKDIAARLKQHGILVHAAGTQKIRACTHLDVSKAHAERVAETIRKLVGQPVKVVAN
ncbi:MAG TPA: low-specificity L-threonine aldolase [Gemmataceae bacterium]|nr:low-specificity L-threonine aldolase [Gemmataceae bacterium]